MSVQTPYALKSYICGEWKTGARDGAALFKTAMLE